ncbi:Glucose-responsive signaling protein [Abortiporus biennis]
MSRLSRTSYAGSMHQRRLSKHRVSDEDLMNYVLRVALLSYQMTPRPVETRTETETAAKEKEPASSRLSGLSNSIFSVGDMFRDIRDGTKAVRFPKDLLKVLEQKLQNIAMGRDPSYSDQLIRRTMAVFYGQVKEETFRKQMKENRKIEELILMFATNATNVLKKEPTLAGDGWKIELNNHIALFVRLLRDCLNHVSHVSTELTARLDMYISKLAPSPPQQSAYSDSGYDSASTSRDSYASPKRLSTSVVDMPLVMTAAKLFKLPDQVAQQEIDELGKYCNEKAALVDLKTCLKNINAGAPFPGRREDFDSEAAWQYWRTLETSHLSQLMLVMVQFNPELAKSAPSEVLPASVTSNGARPGSVYSTFSTNTTRDSYYSTSYQTSSRQASISSRSSLMPANILTSSNPLGATEEVAEEDDIPVGHHFTFIPPNPRKFYKRLLEHCITADLEAMLSPAVGDDEQVSLGILSAGHIELLNECALRWRIGQPYRAAAFLDIVKSFYERNEVPLECVPEALSTVAKVMHEMEFDKWPLQDCEYLAQIYGALFTIFLSNIYHAMDAIPNLKPSEILPYLEILETVQASGLLIRFDVDINARIEDIKEQIKSVSARWYDEKKRELHTANPGVNHALPMLLMTDEIEKGAKNLDKRFPDPLLGRIDIVSLVVDIVVPLFLQDLDSSSKRLYEDSMNGPTPDIPIQDIFSLYRRTKVMMGIYHAFVENGDVEFDVGGFFEPYVLKWLADTHEKTTQWVANAIAADKFQAEGAEGHSSSIIDLFDSLRTPINFLTDLEWTDQFQEAKFFTSVSKTISRAIEQYCSSVEDLFMAEMFPRPTEHLQPQKSSAWLEKAKLLAQTGEKKLESFTFLPESCVKLNNIQAARRLLDSMYAQVQADKKAEILGLDGPPVPEKPDKLPRFLFTVKVSIAEGLVPLDSSPSAKLDTFVTLSDEQGNRVAKTRTIYETLSPRWDETFDITVEKPLWLMVSVRDRALLGKHDTVGRAYICLDPRRYGDFLTHDQWMDLDSQGRILLRISMEGEKDDPQFYFGRAFRSLKRAESDMVRVFIDKVSPFIRQTISRPILKSLVRSGSISIDYNKALNNVTALYRSALGSNTSEVQIPLPQSEKPRFRPEDLTDVEIEQAITPVFDFFDENLPTLNTYLSDSAKEMVMIRVWKEILNVIEGLLIPPLSEISSDMKPLTDKEVDIAFKWLKFLRDYFYAGGEGPVPLEALQNQKYRDVLSIRLYYDWHTDALMEECVRMMQQSLRASPSIKKRAKSVYQQRNLGTIKDRKREKQQEKEVSNGETILRILRMRPGTSDFIAQQLHAMTSMQAEREAHAQELQRRKLARPSRQQGSQQIPPVPAIPPVPPLPPK